MQGVSVKDMVRVMGESRTNGNASPSSSPVPIRKTGAVVIANRSLSAHSSPGVSRPKGSPPFSGKSYFKQINLIKNHYVANLVMISLFKKYFLPLFFNIQNLLNVAGV